MTDDIVARLRTPVEDPFFGPLVEPVKWEAADEIERLRSRSERLEALIRPIAQLAVMGDEKSDPRWKDAPKGDEDIIQANISLGQLRAMRAALSEGGDGWEVKEQK